MFFKIFFRLFLTFCITIAIVINLKASSNSFQPSQLKNQSFIFESNGRIIKKIGAHSFQKNRDVLEKQLLRKSVYRKKFWEFEGKYYDIPIRYSQKVDRIIRRLTTKQRKKIMKGI